MNKHRYTTERLVVDDWHSFSNSEWPAQNLPEAVQQIMTERVTEFLPPAWRGTYSISRASQWIEERDAEGVTLLVIDSEQPVPIGLVILFETELAGHLRLGYMLRESAWGKGYASEIVSGFVTWCKQHQIKSVTGGVETGNAASRRILEKCGFVLMPETQGCTEQLFRIEFA